MKFRARLQMLAFLNTDGQIPLLFTKNHILFPFQGNPFANTDIEHDIKYELKEAEVNGKKQYQVVFGRNKETRVLMIDKWNQKKLKWVHEKYWVQKEPLAWIAILVSMASLIVSIVSRD